MEIKKPIESINSYWLKTITKINIVSLCLALVEALLVGVFVFLLLKGQFEPLPFWGGLILYTLTATIVNLLVFHYLLRPLKDLLAIASKINGEAITSLTPPNVNSNRYKNTGFATAITALLSTKQVHELKDFNEESSCGAINESLDRLKCYIITQNEKGEITYFNEGAPVTIEPGKKQAHHLIFNGKDTLESWVDEASKNSVNSSKVWHRIADQVAGQEDRRLFDVYANYKKGSSNEVILTIIDKTKEYSVDEEALDFIAFAAHELRGPITVIKGYIDVLHDELEETLINDQGELFQRLEVSANKLSSYVNNILNTSRYDRRHLNVHLAEDNYLNVYSDIADDMNLRAIAQGRNLEVLLKNDVPSVAIDKNSISEVMSNLIDNAIKYSNEGGLITISSEHTGDHVDFIVTDRGIGMPSNVMSNLFQKFYRSHRSRETVAGTGIGLYISKAIVESHGGTISVTSEEGKGSTFTVSLPTFASVKEELDKEDGNGSIIKAGDGWIKNHGMYRG